ncbi:MAG: ribonuclease J [Eubacteriales bacterium]|nr:ribonuclease J [Clostridia bacterium]MDY5754059.1 ribonuclease J [Eubacteriales bacterium]
MKVPKQVKIIPLGGLGEIGKNMTVIEYGGDMIVVDCGLSFPDEEMLGIDLVIPDMTYVERNLDKLRGIFITHGHEDHIGALPYALKRFKAPVFATRLTLALIQHKLDEHGISNVDMRCISAGDTVKQGCFSIEFIKINHSIADAVALAIHTPAGVIIHTGDFKLDYTPLDSEPLDLSRFAWYGAQGVLALMSDSTNVERPGYTQSEREIGTTFESCFERATGRVIVASFASNIYRIQQIASIAIAHNRVVCFQGKSMVNIAQMALDMGYLNLARECVVDVDRLKDFSDDRICVITTGSQGEPMSGLFRMANATHKLNVGDGDMVIISASAIPGNEKGVARVINQLFRRGVEVVYDAMADVHVSGHARQEELRLMLALTKPKYFIPVHGEHRHLYKHAELAKEMGMVPDHIFIAEIGDVIELGADKGRIAAQIPGGSVLVDGLGVGDIGNSVLRDRRILSSDGLVTAVIAIDKRTGALCTEPEVISRGFVYVRDSEELIVEAKDIIKERALEFTKTNKSEWGQVKNSIRSALKDALYRRTRREPMIMPIVIEIE